MRCEGACAGRIWTLFGMRPWIAVALIMLCALAVASIGSAFVPESVHAHASAKLHSLMPSFRAPEPRDDLVIVFKPVPHLLTALTYRC